MGQFRPKFITFDCYGTMTNFQMGPVARELFADRIRPEQMDAFVADFAAYRLDEVLGDWKPYSEVLCNSIERLCRKWGLEFSEEEGLRFYHAVPTWGPHPDVPDGLQKVAHEIPLVILSNAMNEQIHQNVEKLGAPFAHVFTAQDAQAYKPRLQAFEYMFDQLGCRPQDVLHISASPRYDLMVANDLGIKHKVFVNRGFEPSTPGYDYYEVNLLSQVPPLLGL